MKLIIPVTSIADQVSDFSGLLRARRSLFLLLREFLECDPMQFVNTSLTVPQPIGDLVPVVAVDVPHQDDLPERRLQVDTRGRYVVDYGRITPERIGQERLKVYSRNRRLLCRLSPCRSPGDVIKTDGCLWSNLSNAVPDAINFFPECSASFKRPTVNHCADSFF